MNDHEQQPLQAELTNYKKLLEALYRAVPHGNAAPSSKKARTAKYMKVRLPEPGMDALFVTVMKTRNVRQLEDGYQLSFFDYKDLIARVRSIIYWATKENNDGEKI